MRAVIALAGALATLSACAGPTCQSTCNRIYSTNECSIAVPGYSDAAGRAELIRQCIDECSVALQHPGALGGYDPNRRHTSGSSIELENEQQAAAWMDCVEQSPCESLSDGYCAPI